MTRGEGETVYVGRDYYVAAVAKETDDLLLARVS